MNAATFQDLERSRVVHKRLSTHAAQVYCTVS